MEIAGIAANPMGLRFAETSGKEEWDRVQ